MVKDLHHIQVTMFLKNRFIHVKPHITDLLSTNPAYQRQEQKDTTMLKLCTFTPQGVLQ